MLPARGDRRDVEAQIRDRLDRDDHPGGDGGEMARNELREVHSIVIRTFCSLLLDIS